MPVEDAISPTASWLLLHDRFYRKHEIYRMRWRDINLLEYEVAVAPNGGPIALVRSQTKLLALHGRATKPQLQFYSGSGSLIHQVDWDGGKMAGFGWSQNQRLVCVMEDGTVRSYSLFGEYCQFGLGQEALEDGIIEAKVLSSSLIALTSKFELIAVTNFDEPRPKKVACANLLERPLTFTPMPGHLSASGAFQVLVSTSSVLYICDFGRFAQMSIKGGPFTHISPSENGKFLALLSTNSTLYVTNSDCTSQLAEIQLDTAVVPVQVCWCASDAVSLVFPDVLTIVGPFGSSLTLNYPFARIVATESDGLRVISNQSHEFIQRVPDITHSIFRIGSINAGALLYDAWKNFERKSQKADENIRTIGSQLNKAVDECIEGAGLEFDHELQKALLRAAAFGSSFLSNPPTQAFQDMARTLRVMNALCSFDIGIAVTLPQFNNLGIDAVLSRILDRRNHLLAFRMCEFLGIGKQRVLVSWACDKVRYSTADPGALSRLLLSKLQGVDGVSYAEVAKTAFNRGFTKLAINLLDFEPHASTQVPLLLSMDEEELALEKAIESLDTDLIYTVLSHLHRKLTLSEFFATINSRRTATALFLRYCREQNPQLLKDFFFQDDRKSESALSIVQEALQTESPQERMELFKAASSLLGEHKKYAFESKTLSEQVKFEERQQIMFKNLNRPVLSSSINGTIVELLTEGNLKMAEKLKTDLKLSEKRWCYQRLSVLVHKRNWDGLDKFGKSKPAIGYIPIVEELIRAGEFEHAKKVRQA